MTRYEGLFIINNAAREEGVKETIDRISEEITKSGGTVETVQKMDKRSFTRVADKRFTSGFYANVIFENDPAQLAGLRSRFAASEDIFRVMFTISPAKKSIVE